MTWNKDQKRDTCTNSRRIHSSISIHLSFEQNAQPKLGKARGAKNIVNDNVTKKTAIHYNYYVTHILYWCVNYIIYIYMYIYYYLSLCKYRRYDHVSHPLRSFQVSVFVMHFPLDDTLHPVQQSRAVIAKQYSLKNPHSVLLTLW